MEHKRYKMLYDGGHFVDGIEFDDFEDAKDNAIETLIMWMAEESYFWERNENGIPCLTELQIENWNWMIGDCCVCIVEWDEEAKDWEDVDDAWYPSYEDENEIGWMEWEELKKKNNW